ncbi:MAG: hypothetical protein LC803_17690 [Acidobacteria bacterium]|nr:hypothetical protein [Acidobacteriota bacterium]
MNHRLSLFAPLPLGLPAASPVQAATRVHASTLTKPNAVSILTPATMTALRPGACVVASPRAILKFEVK